MAGVKAVDALKLFRGKGKRTSLKSNASSIGMGNVPAHEQPAGIKRIYAKRNFG